jgi:hypothetical protein
MLIETVEYLSLPESVFTVHHWRTTKTKKTNYKRFAIRFFISMHDKGRKVLMYTAKGLCRVPKPPHDKGPLPCKSLSSVFHRCTRQCPHDSGLQGKGPLSFPKADKNS